MMRFTNFVKKFAANCDGATAIEYGLIVSLIVIAIIGSLNSFANSTTGMWSTVSTTVVSQNNKVER
jgi:pilus assembly protein Flp/PilA